MSRCKRSEENDYTFEKNDEMEIDKVSNHGKNIKNCKFLVNLTDTENAQHLEKHVPNAQKRIILQLFVRQRMRSRNSRKKNSFYCWKDLMRMNAFKRLIKKQLQIR